MANFTPSKKTANDFHNGVQYVSGEGNVVGDTVEAETINNLVESALYTQEQADTAVATSNSANDTAQNALTLINNAISGASLPPNVGLHHIQYSGEPTPAEIWSGTTWEIDTAYQGKSIIGSGGDYALGATGGSANAIVVEHTHAITAHYESVGNSTAVQRGFYGSGTGLSLTEAVAKTGVSGIGKNMPPYIVVNYWKRTA